MTMGRTHIYLAGALVVALAIGHGCGGSSGSVQPQPDGSDDAAEASDASGCLGTQAESTYAACTDGCDNDGDSYIDCDDHDCCGVLTGCPSSTYCGRHSSPDGGSCTSGPENTYAACTDGCDNDGDSYIDCDDRDCCAVLAGCPPSTYCGRNEASAENSAAACENSLDDDGDGTSDCGDVDCCDVRACPLDSGCNPVWCLDGIAELLSTPPNGDPPTLTTLTSTTTFAVGPFDLYVAGFDILWSPERSVPYTTTCVAIDQFVRSWACSVSVHAQAWKEGDTCGFMRGVLHLTAPDGLGWISEVKLASGVGKTEDQVEFAQ